MQNESANSQSTEQTIGLLKFYLIAGLIFGALLYFYTTYVITSIRYEIYLEHLAAWVSQFMNTVFGENSEVWRTASGLKSRIQMPDYAFIELSPASDASGVFFALIAMIMAWPAKILLRLSVTLVGVALVFCLNILRVVGVLMVDIYHPFYFDMINDWVFPAILILCAFGYFLLWMRISGVHPRDFG